MKKPFVLTVFVGAGRIEKILNEMNVESFEKIPIMSNGFHGTRFEIQPFSGKGSREKNKKLIKLCYN